MIDAQGFSPDLQDWESCTGRAPHFRLAADTKRAGDNVRFAH